MIKIIDKILAVLAFTSLGISVVLFIVGLFSVSFLDYTFEDFIPFVLKAGFFIVLAWAFAFIAKILLLFK